MQNPRAGVPCVEDETGWCQEALFGELVIEGKLLIGMQRDDGHLQIQLEVRNPQSGELLAMRSFPHLKPDFMADAALRALELLLEDIERLV
uniref:Uncharacterized protein n=1 Tax=uncultured prokaryote TaxID=198431 RepID=A0A0H5Q460_9ZZZZ|nr:hypothetical protein [uncultured prokaryote]